ncbi:MAG: DUF1972 domain-containing protein [Muribaculaceae bacterium]|nr:DUF1972 domain-containing protein [Muribaculaceae bacterium]
MDKTAKKRKRVAIIGSQGVPPQYGGFETLVDNIVKRHDPEAVEYTVFCSKPDMKTDMSHYRGCRLRYVDIHAHGVMSVPYDIVSMIMAARGYDDILVLGVSGCVFLPVLRLLTRAKIIVNIDGLEHKRDKWQNMARRFLKFSLDTCVRWAHEIVSDNKGIQDYVRSTYRREARLIAYGGDHALRDVSDRRQQAILDFYGLKAGCYDLSICRIEPENNCHTTLEAYDGSGKTITIVGNWHHSDYSRDLYTRYKDKPGIRLIQPVYDLDILYALRNNMRLYVHGHRAGGTNPSLVEAMFFGKPILTYDVIYNRETTENKAYYYTDKESLARLVCLGNLDGSDTTATARREYIWQKIARLYESLY